MLNTQADINQNSTDIKEKLQQVDIIMKDKSIPEDEKGDAKVLLAEIQELKKWNDELIPLQNGIKILHDGMKVAFNVGETKLKEDKARLDINEKKYKSLSVAWGSIFKAQGLFGGNPGERNEFELSMQEIQRSSTMKAANIDSFMEMIKPMVKKASLSEKVNDIQVKELMEKIRVGDFDKMLEEFGQNKIELSPIPNAIAETASYAGKGNKYDQFFNK